MEAGFCTGTRSAKDWAVWFIRRCFPIFRRATSLVTSFSPWDFRVHAGSPRVPHPIPSHPRATDTRRLSDGRAKVSPALDISESYEYLSPACRHTRRCCHDEALAVRGVCFGTRGPASDMFAPEHLHCILVVSSLPIYVLVQVQRYATASLYHLRASMLLSITHSEAPIPIDVSGP